MATLWTYAVIITGSIIHGQPGEPPEFVSGLVETKSALYFASEEACNAARERSMASLPAALMNLSLESGKASITECAAVEMQVNTVE